MMSGRTPRFKYFKESGEEEYHSFLGVPLIDRGVLQGVLVVQTKEPRIFREDEIRMLVEAANQVAPVVSEARTLDRFIGPAQERLWSLARNLWWSWDQDCISLFRDLNPTRWRQLNQNPISLLSEIPLEEIERRATELVLHSRINYVYRRQQEYLHADRTWGAAQCGRAAASSGGLFFRRVRAARIAAHLFRRPGRAGRRPHQERIRPGYSADRHRACFTGRATFCSAWTRAAGSGRSTCKPMSTSCPCSRPSARTASRSWWRFKPAAARSAPRSGRVKVGRCDLCCWTRTWREMRPRISN